MVFPSVPVYLDPPNWNQQHGHEPAIGGGVGGGGDARHLQPVPVQTRPEGNMAAGSARPASMTDRARLAKVPQPEPGLKCPRCESTNTKFCYFNNYSLSQPRHFCKTCRRYWTRGGALRNVPVGGGCRRNKRSRSSGSAKSSAAASADRQVGNSAPSATTSVAATGGACANTTSLPPQHHLPFMSSLNAVHDYGLAANIGLGFGGVQPMDETGSFQVGSSSGAGLQEQWRLQQVQQFPFLAGLEPPAPAPSLGLFPFNGQGVMDGGGFAGPLQGKQSVATALNTHHMGSVKSEEAAEGLNLRRQYLGFSRNDQYWGGGGGGGGTSGGSGSGTGGWTDLSGFNSASSCSNFL